MKARQVVIINGNGGVGKDTFIDVLKRITLYGEVKIWNHSSIDKIKEIAKMIGWNGVKDEKSRKLLSDLKVLCDDYNNMTFEDMKKKVLEFNNSDASLLFLHIREPHNIEVAKKAFDALTVLVVRDSVQKITSNASDEHVADYEYDFIVDNNSDINQLEREGHRFLQFVNSVMRDGD